MKVKYAERGTFDAEKAARALIALYNRINKKVDQKKENNDEVKNNTDEKEK